MRWHQSLAYQSHPLQHMTLLMVKYLSDSKRVCAEVMLSYYKARSQVNLQSSEEVFVFEVHNLFEEVLHEDTNEPDLLVGHKTASTFIESVFAELVLETFTKFV